MRAAQEGKTDLTEWQEVLDFITEDAGRYRSLEEWQEAQELYREQLQCRGNCKEWHAEEAGKTGKQRDHSADGTCGKGAGIRPCVDPGL